MKTTRLFVVVAGLALSSVLPARAQYRSFLTQDRGFYSRFDLGGGFLEDGRVKSFTGGPSGGRIEYSPAFTFDAAVGYAFNAYTAVEFELGAHGSEINSAKGFAVYDTFLYNAPFMANVVFQYPIPRTRIVPYVGAGAGGSVTVFHTDGFSNGTTTLYGEDAEVVFAYQAFAGVRVNLNERLSVGVGYRYFVAQDSTFTYYPAYPGTGPNVNLGLEGAHSHLFSVVFQMKF